MEGEIVNRVAESGLVQIELDDFLPKKEIIAFDIAGNLYEGLILREKDFRAFISDHNWDAYTQKTVAVHCSADAIIPQWAYMLLASKLGEVGADYHFGSVSQVKESMLLKAIREMPLIDLSDKRVLVKGCSLDDASPAVYMEVTRRLQPVVKSLMFGEACSTVPVFKRKV